jgi:cytochrome c oxidase subunit 1
MFLWSGASSIPRRWAVHYEAWQLQSQVATVFAAVVILVTTLFIVGYVKGLMWRGAKT